MNRLKVFFSFMALVLFKILISFGILVFLILFSPVFILTNDSTFLKLIDELYKNIK